MKKFFGLVLLILIGCVGSSTYSQQPHGLTPTFHQERRDELRYLMPPHSVAVLFGAPIRNRSNSVDYIYHQSPNFYYLTGWREPHAVLILFSENQIDEIGNFDEILFVRPKDPYHEMWEGKRLGIQGAKEMGFDRVMTKENFKNYHIDFETFEQILFFNFQNDIIDTNDASDLFDLVQNFQSKMNYSEKALKSNNFNQNLLRQYLTQLREIKTPEEIELLKKAIFISVQGQLEVMKAINESMTEREIQGIHEFVHKKYGANDVGYPSIVGSGNNACILHYRANNKNDIKGELVLMDVGAEFQYYTGDITRTIPASGKFNDQQKAIYQIVFEAQKAGIDAARLGNSFRSIYSASSQVIKEGLLNLGIIGKPEEYRKYFPHGVTHHIGLDVHDWGEYQDLKENMVITIEPGIYIPEGSDCDPKWWDIGIRIEDDILISTDGPINLSVDLPRYWKDIEATIALPSALDDFKLPPIKD